VCYVLYSDNFRGEAVKTILLALILGVCLQAVAQQQEWGADNCLWTSAGYRSWAQTNACRILEGGNPNAFVIYDRRDSARTPIMRVDLSKAGTTGWIYAYNYAQRSDVRYIYRGVWNPPPANSADYQVYSNGAWVTPPPAAVAAAPQPQPAPQQGGDVGTQLQTQQQMNGLNKSINPPNPKPVCGITTPDNVSCH
jgi:hypothetical protein